MSASFPRPTERWANAGWVLLLAPVTVGLVFLALDHSKPVLALLGLLVLVGLSVLVPVRVLLWLTLFSFALVPFHYLALRQPLDAFAPPTLLLAATALGAVRRPQRSAAPAGAGFARFMGVGFIAYVTLVSFTSPYSNSRHAVTWTLLTALLLVVVPLVLGRYPADTALLRAFDVLGLLLAVMALVESRSKHNPLDSLYAHSPDHLTQSWGVYRVFTTLGHPLVNGTVFAVTLTVVWCSFLKKPSWSRALLMAGLVGAIFVTASRGALLAAGVGVVVAVVARMAGRGGRSRKFTAVVLVLVAIAGGTMAWSSSVLGERNSSVEGADSADLRLTLLKRTPDMLHQTHFLGSGADTSFAVWAQVGGVYSKYPLENSVIQFVVDFGVLGTLLYVAFVLALALPAVRRGAVTGPAALAAYLVGAGGFNLFEAYPSALVIPSLLLTLTVMEARAAGAAAEAPTVADATRAPAAVAAAATTAASVVAGAR